MAAAALEGFGVPGDLILDPFGASPRLVREAALAGRAVLVASNNPVTRFVVRRVLQPFPLPVLQAALSRLAAAPKDEGRLEPFLLALYNTTCSRCGETVSADYFVWDRETDAPLLRSYSCPHCSHTMEEPTEAEDRSLAVGFRRRELQHSLALEQLAPRGDPDREHAEAALSAYPDRAVYAIVTLLNKLEQLALGQRITLARRASARVVAARSTISSIENGSRGSWRVSTTWNSSTPGTSRSASSRTVGLMSMPFTLMRSLVRTMGPTMRSPVRPQWGQGAWDRLTMSPTR